MMVLTLLLALLLAACGGEAGDEAGNDAAGDETTEGCPQDFSSSEIYPIFVSSEVVVGENRFLIGLLDENDAPVASEDIDVSATFEPVQADGSAVEGTSFEFIETDPASGRGLYVASVEFPGTGVWAADVAIAGGGYEEAEVRGCFEVAETGMTPAIGAPAPASETATSKDAKDLSEISTDTKPVPRFYELSVADAIEAGEPFVVTFATPKYCSSQVCGPTLDIVKGVAKQHPDVIFIHSEIYEGLEPNNPPLEAVLEWGLPSEPWVFVVDSAGKVAAKYEGTVSARELESALAEVQ
jgi:hypothetical protein